MAKILAIIFGSIVLFGIVIALMFVSYSNEEISLRNAAEAQQKANEAVFDNVWKTIQQEAEITENYKDSFHKIWKDIIGARYEKERGGALLSFIKEHNPNFSTKLYEKLMVTVESQRKEFLNNQKKLIDIKREHDNLIQQFPSSLVCGSRPELEIIIITSEKTEEIFKKKKEDDVNVFPKK
jgi:hypothetical protein